MATSSRAFVLHHAQLRPVPGLEGVRLHLADEVLPLWHAVQVETGDPDAALPYWAFAWAGGLALSRYVSEHPEAVAGQRVFDLASGSGLCAIASIQAGAAEATGADIDAFAAAAITLNARANGCRVTAIRRDVLDEDPPDVDVILAGDCWYEARLAERVLPWLRRARELGIVVLVGDPGRRYLPAGELVELAAYEVRTTTELEDMERKRAWVYALRPSGASPISDGPAWPDAEEAAARKTAPSGTARVEKAGNRYPAGGSTPSFTVPVGGSSSPRRR